MIIVHGLGLNTSGDGLTGCGYYGDEHNLVTMIDSVISELNVSFLLEARRRLLQGMPAEEI